MELAGLILGYLVGASGVMFSVFVVAGTYVEDWRVALFWGLAGSVLFTGAFWLLAFA